MIPETSVIFNRSAGVRVREDIVMCIKDYRHGFVLANRFIEYLQVLSTVSSYALKFILIKTRK
jgi:hypothetical protein